MDTPQEPDLNDSTPATGGKHELAIQIYFF